MMRPPAPVRPASRSFPLGRIAFSLLPLAGVDRRATTQQEIVRGKVWTHDQLQGVLAVNVPVRQTVVKLSDAAGGGLLVHNPVAPTEELYCMMSELEEAHGEVKHIVLGTLGLEHKALAGPFAKRFPQATVWANGGQWSWPLPLPLPLFGFPSGRKLRELPAADAPADAQPPWLCDLEYKVLGPLCVSKLIGGYFGESAVRPSRPHRPAHKLPCSPSTPTFLLAPVRALSPSPISVPLPTKIPTASSSTSQPRLCS